jgi:hypothetical protein
MLLNTLTSKSDFPGILSVVKQACRDSLRVNFLDRLVPDFNALSELICLQLIVLSVELCKHVLFLLKVLSFKLSVDMSDAPIFLVVDRTVAVRSGRSGSRQSR